MKNYSLSLILVIFLFSCKKENTVLSYHDKPLINGVIEVKEWSNALKKDISRDFEIYLYEDNSNYYLAIRNKTEIPFYVDMFLLISDSLYNIHSSSQLGERKLDDPNWNDQTPMTNWGYTNDWTSNFVNFDKFKLKELRDKEFKGNVYLESVMPYDGFEFQFSKKTWKLNKSKIRIELRNMVGIEDYVETIFPENSERKNQENWHILKFK